MVSLIDKLSKAFPHIQQGLKQGELNIVVAPIGMSSIPSVHNEHFFRNYKLEQIGYQITDDPVLHARIRKDGERINRKTYEFLIGSPELYPYYVHNIFRDIMGIEKIYDYELPPITKVLVPDLPTASAYIENFKFIMAGQSVKIPYEIKKTLSAQKGKTTKVIIELITLDV